MATGIISWSQTAATNATADSNVNWAEGQAPSTVNDSARAMMASAAKWRDDITGVNVTAGSGTAYTLTSNQVIAANVDGMTIQFTPGTTNTGDVTLSIDGQTARRICFRTGTALAAGVLISGSLYQVTYRAATTEYLLHSFDSSLASIPIGAMIDYAGTTAPSSNFVFPYGQQVSQSTYATLYSRFGSNAYGSDGGGLFYLPDLRGRVVAGKDNMGGSSANRILDLIDGDVLGTVGGNETRTLLTANLPAYTPAGSISNGAIDDGGAITGAATFSATIGAGVAVPNGTGAASSQGTSTFTGTAQGGTSTAFGILQPTIILNKILRII
jgi:microcystin-dependent protein